MAGADLSNRGALQLPVHSLATCGEPLYLLHTMAQSHMSNIFPVLQIAGHLI